MRPERLVAVDGAEEQDRGRTAGEAARQERPPLDGEPDRLPGGGNQASSDLPKSVAKP